MGPYAHPSLSGYSEILCSDIYLPKEIMRNSGAAGVLFLLLPPHDLSDPDYVHNTYAFEWEV